MPIHPHPDHVAYEMHGSRFRSFVSPSRGSARLCAWQVEVAPRLVGQEHVVSEEEVLLVLRGRPLVSIDGEEAHLEPGDVVHVPAGSAFRLDNPAGDSAALWVTTSTGLTAVLADDTTITPPWTL